MIKENRITKAIKSGDCVVLGFGVSNAPLPKILLSYGAKSVTVRDIKSAAELGKNAEELESAGVAFVCGENYLDSLADDANEKTVIFRSPGIRNDEKHIAAALKKGALLTSEMELFVSLTTSDLIAVTGSDGKTTTTTVISEILGCECKKSGKRKVFVGGNIGAPLLPSVEKMGKDDFAVLELSSFQLQTFEKSPRVAVITNITPNHLNWHTGMDEYIEAKKNIYSHSAKRLVTNAENEITLGLARDSGIGDIFLFSSKKTSYDEIFPEDCGFSGHAVFERGGDIIVSDGKNEEKMISSSDIRIPGRHNIENYMAAIGALYGLVSPESVKEVAQNFPGVEHRLEFVREFGGVKYYNSSIDSTPTRTAAALSALKEKPIVICGGYDKHIPFSPLADSLCERAKAVILVGATSQKIMDALLECDKFDMAKLPVFRESAFLDAVMTARRIAVPGDTVLLSPACAAFDLFKNFAERGKVFKEIVNDF